MPGLTKKRPTRALARITVEMPGASTCVLELQPQDAKAALRLLRGVVLMPAKAVDRAKNDEPARPWREVLGEVLNKHGGEAAAMVRACRDAKGLTQQQLAAAVGLQKSNISEIERGRRAVGKTLARKLAAVLDTDYRMFL